MEIFTDQFTLGLFLLVLLLFGFAPRFVIRVVILAWPRGHPRRDELWAELAILDYWQRPFWVAEQIEAAIVDGLLQRFLAHSPTTTQHLRAGSMLSPERYLRDKQDETQEDLPSRVAAWLQNHLSYYTVETQTQTRGRRRPTKYHTCLVFVPRERAGPSGSEAACLQAENLHRDINQELRSVDVSAHWELSLSCKPVGHHGDEVLIIESYYDNKPSTANRRDLEKWATVAPVVLFGVYYSGVKDVVVELHKHLELGAFDVSRYIAQVIRDTQPFRGELQLQSQVFWNLVESPLGKDLVVTVDDYKALVESQRAARGRRLWGERLKRGKLPGTAVLLELDEDLLEYAAYRVVANKVASGEEPEPTDERMRVEEERRQLADAQKKLKRLTARFEHRLGPVVISIADSSQAGAPRVQRREDGSYDDQIDEMFDAYRDVADDLADRLVAHRDRTLRHRRQG
jgi:hypothetical protein